MFNVSDGGHVLDLIHWGEALVGSYLRSRGTNRSSVAWGTRIALRTSVTTGTSRARLAISTL